MSYILDLLSLIEGDVVPFRRQATSGPSNDNKLPGSDYHGLERQQHLIDTVHSQSRKIDSEGANRFALPFIKRTSEDTHSLHSLKRYVKNPEKPYHATVVDHIRRNHADIMNHIDNKLERLSGLKTLANQAPHPEDIHQTVDNNSRKWLDNKNYFGKVFPRVHGV